jgi:hypothetical protein
MIWHRLGVFATLFSAASPVGVRRAAVRRWRRAFADQPELAEDIIRMAGVMALTPPARDAAPNLEQLAYEAGRRDFGLQLLALGQITPYELKQMMGDDDA